MCPRDHCCLCGIKFGSKMKRRMLNAKELASFVRNQCRPTPFVYRMLIAPECLGGTVFGVCIPCVNWKRRISVLPAKRRLQPMLQLDQLVYYLLRPGFFIEPDRRCIGRLLAGVRQPGNPFIRAFPLPAQTILSNLKDNTYDECVRAWWDYNGNTEFFGSGAEAKRVRSFLNCM